MQSRLDGLKSELLAKAAELAAHRRGSGVIDPSTAAEFLAMYYRHVAPE